MDKDSEKTNKKNQTSKTLKEGLKIFIIFWLSILILGCLTVGAANYFPICCFILCILLLIPKIYLQVGFKKSVRYTLIIMLFLLGCFTVKADKTADETTNNKKKSEKEEIISVLKGVAYIKDDSKQEILIEKKGDKYIATIPFNPLFGYNTELESAMYGFSFLNNMYSDFPDTHKKIEKYILNFYSKDDKITFTSEYINENNKVEQLSIVSAVDGTAKTITREETRSSNSTTSNTTSDNSNATNDNSNTTNSASSNSTTSSATNDNSNVYSNTFDENNINKTINCKEKKVTIKYLRRATSNENQFIPENKEYVGIYVNFENKSNGDMYYGETDFTLINGNGEVIDTPYLALKNVFDHERLNNGTLVAKAQKEGYVIFINDLINDKKMQLRFVCEDNIIFDDVIKTVNLY